MISQWHINLHSIVSKVNSFFMFEPSVLTFLWITWSSDFHFSIGLFFVFFSLVILGVLLHWKLAFYDTSIKWFSLSFHFNLGYDNFSYADFLKICDCISQTFF